MKQDLPRHLSHTCSLTVDESLLVPAVSKHFTGFADMPPVFASAFLVGFVEWACVDALTPYLSPGEASVGVGLDLRHLAPTPTGLSVTAQVRLIERKGRRLWFAVTCHDELDVIAEGLHERAVVDRAAFMDRAGSKAAIVARRRVVAEGVD